MLPQSIRIVLFDMAGTTVDDRSAGGSSLVIQAMTQAFADAQIFISPDMITRHRGKPKRDAVFSILKDQNLHRPGTETDRIYDAFLAHLREGLHGLKEMPGASDVFGFLNSREIRVVVGSGFPQEIVDALVTRLEWRQSERSGSFPHYLKSVLDLGVRRPSEDYYREVLPPRSPAPSKQIASD